MKPLHKTLTRFALVATAATLAAGQTAFAQDTDDNAIVVTGSRIRVDPLSREQPIIGLGQDEIGKTGLTSTADILQRLPISGGGLNTRFNNSGNFGNPPDGGGVGAGAAEVDLRFLGSPRVLVLVDGLRWVHGASASGVPGSVDLNSIPAAMIDRIEVLQEGASPIYGSDAIAGVVNIITRRDQVGLQATGQYGGYLEEGDGQTQEYNVSWGLEQGRTNIVVGAGYAKQDSVLASDRAISQFPTPGATACDATCSSGTPLGRFIIFNPTLNDFVSITLRGPVGPGVVPNYNVLDPTDAASDFKDFTTADRFNFQPYNYVLTPSERTSVFAQITHDFSDMFGVRVRASFVERDSANQAAPLPLFVGPDAGNGNLLDTVVVDATNPFNPFGMTLGPGTYAFIGRRMVEAGPRHYEQEVGTSNVTATFYGELPAFGRAWHWDANWVYSVNHAEQTFTGNLNALNVQQALGPAAACTAPCTPLNIFGGEGSITPDMLAFVGFVEHAVSEQTLSDLSFNITGDLFDMPAGPFSFAAGYEFRDTKGFFEPDPIVAAGFSSDIPAQPTSGQVKVHEAYLELRIPIISNQPLFRELTGSIAGRVFDYSTFGTDQTFKAGLRWRPTEDTLFRFSWGEGFRAPSIGELFGSPSRFDQEVADPCSDMLGLSGGPVASATVQANCIARGVPNDGSYVQLNAQLPVITSGNQALQPETSEAYNVGFVWQPSALEDTSWSSRVTFEVNYADITLDSAIKTVGAELILNRCAESLDALACAAITRTASGAISGIDNPLVNIGGIETRAVDLTVNYLSPDTSMGTFAITASTSHLIEFTDIVPTATGFTNISREGTERGSPDQAYPEWKSSVRLDWDLGGFGASITGRYISEVEEPASSANTLDSVFYLDLQGRWRPDFLDDHVVFTIGVNNVTDEDPPGCFSCGLNNFDPTTYDVPGRFGYFRIAYTQ